MVVTSFSKGCLPHSSYKRNCSQPHLVLFIKNKVIHVDEAFEIVYVIQLRDDFIYFISDKYMTGVSSLLNKQFNIAF